VTALLALVTGAALLGFAWVRRRRGAFGAPPALRLISRAGLTQKAGLALVEVEGRRLLVGYGDGPPSLLATVADRPRADGACLREVR
jgi:flagellar protein FliO/FliZ